MECPTKSGAPFTKSRKTRNAITIFANINESGQLEESENDGSGDKVSDDMAQKKGHDSSKEQEVVSEGKPQSANHVHRPLPAITPLQRAENHFLSQYVTQTPSILERDYPVSMHEKPSDLLLSLSHSRRHHTSLRNTLASASASRPA